MFSLWTVSSDSRPKKRNPKLYNLFQVALFTRSDNDRQGWIVIFLIIGGLMVMVSIFSAFPNYAVRL